MKNCYSITELANIFDITSRTIRHYEDIGLLSPERVGTQRIFTNGDHVRLGLILRGKRIGWSLNEIKEIISMYELPQGEDKQTSFLLNKVEERRKLLKARQKDIRNMLTELENIEHKLLN